jgi:septation ring formation regulator EzrA
MKDVFLTIIAGIITVNLIIIVCVYCQKANEIATIERIEAISNGIINDAINTELNKLNDEKLTEVLGL